MEAIEIIRQKKYIGKIHQDTEPESPRAWDNIGIMVCFHKRYNLGDKTDLTSKSFESWEELRQHLIKKEKVFAILPLRLYDHSGISISTTTEYPYNCCWDSGQVGFIYTTRERIKEYLGKTTTKKKAEEYLKGEVEDYNKYLTGEVYKWGVYKLCKECGAEEEYTDGCCGYYDLEQCRNELKENLKGLE